MTQAHKEALKHLAIVFLYSEVSSILPILLAYIQNDPRWCVTFNDYKLGVVRHNPISERKETD